MKREYIGSENRFEIKERLGVGGMGEVFKAYDTKLQEIVAIKSITGKYAQKKEVIDMFLNEAKTSLKITHKNVVRVRDILHFEGNYYLIMQFVDGYDLKRWMRLNIDIKSRDAKEMFRLIKPIFEALAHAHEYTIHRDIKPANIMLDSQDGEIYLMDFGIATVTKGSKITDVIKDKKMTVGTPAYMPPEQIKGSKDIDKRVDIFAMGVVYYELLTKQKPNRLKIALPSHFNESVNPELDAIIIKMLALNPKERYHNCLDIIYDIEAVLKGKKISNVETIITKAGEINQENFETVAEGKFYRGSGLESSIAVEKPRKRIHLDEYRISIYPVTNIEYAEFLKENKTVTPPDSFNDICNKKPNHPVTNVSWDEAMLYCKWIGAKLPTEAQWEKSAKGTKSRIYPWGNEFNQSYCNIENSIGESIAVNSFENGISQYGCYQMSGNIWEWCLDDFVDNFYKTRGSKNANPIAITNSDTKVLRGGSYNFVKSSARTSYRYYSRRNHKDETIGFRVVLD
jgi:serine/threonine protein kinase